MYIGRLSARFNEVGNINSRHLSIHVFDFISLDPINDDEGNTFDDIEMKNDDESDEEEKPPTPPPPQLSKKRNPLTKTEDGGDYVTISVPAIKKEFSKSKTDIKENNSPVLGGELLLLLIQIWSA